ncbi:MAG: hypothetical protein EON59_00970 [Alphaproteobacteria bacterium]|nr:MAG: hypothetical protein EON59_00970 [Alphaproteobacteria bacterium]
MKRMLSNGDEMIGVRKAAGIARVSEQTIRNLADAGKIASERNSSNNYRVVSRHDASRLATRFS